MVHDRNHTVPPIKMHCDIDKKHNEHLNKIGFCFNCFENICTECDKSHEEHYITKLWRFNTINEKSRITSFYKLINYSKICI